MAVQARPGRTYLDLAHQILSVSGQGEDLAVLASLHIFNQLQARVRISAHVSLPCLVLYALMLCALLCACARPWSATLAKRRSPRRGSCDFQWMLTACRRNYWQYSAGILAFELTLSMHLLPSVHAYNRVLTDLSIKGAYTCHSMGPFPSRNITKHSCGGKRKCDLGTMQWLGHCVVCSSPRSSQHAAEWLACNYARIPLLRELPARRSIPLGSGNLSLASLSHLQKTNDNSVCVCVCVCVCRNCRNTSHSPINHNIS
jgi:hypothetical protein